MASHSSWRAYLPAGLVATLGLIVAGGIASANAPRAPGDTVAAVYPPWWSSARILGTLVESDSRLLRAGGADNILVLRLGPDGADAVERSGALLLLDPISAAGCLSLSVEAVGSRDGIAISNSEFASVRRVAE